jgi:putative methyltransferase (TIGR04325 family)
MKRMKEIIKLLTPPIMISLCRRLKNEHIAFSGVYNSIDEIQDENPWIQEQWIGLSKDKLRQTGRISSDSFMPTSDFSGYFILPCLLANLLSQIHPCNILDFAGGTGFVYFKIYPYLLNPENVTYHVVDSNVELFQIGENHAKSMGIGKGIVFHKEMPAKGDIQLDILHINASLQYIKVHMTIKFQSAYAFIMLQI